jgi:hypothetical protein
MLNSFSEEHLRASRALRLVLKAERLKKWHSQARAQYLLDVWQSCDRVSRSDLNRQRLLAGAPCVFAAPMHGPDVPPMTDADIPF